MPESRSTLLVTIIVNPAVESRIRIFLNKNQINQCMRSFKALTERAINMTNVCIHKQFILVT